MLPTAGAPSAYADAVPDYVVSAASTATFGRVVLSARSHHVVIDGPTTNGCPGEALTPSELFLGGVASCAAELVQVIARERGLPAPEVTAEVEGTIDRAHRIRDDVTVFESVVLRFGFAGVSESDATTLVEAFKGR